MSKEREFIKLSNRRITIVFIVLFIFSLLIVYRLVEVHIIKHQFFERKFEEQSIGRIKVPSFRGRILDRNGVVLAYSLPAYSIALRPMEIDLKQLPKIYDFFKSNGIKLPSYKDFSDRVILMREEGINFYFVERKFTNKADKLNNDFKGIEIIKEPTGKRYYNFESVSDIIGMVNIDEEGLEGLELYLDKYYPELKGRDGYYDLFFDAIGRPNYNKIISYVPPVDGKDITLSIDVVLQQNLYELAKRKLEYHKASEVDIVVSNRMGEVLACVSVEKNKNNYMVGAINKVYEPGSIFKVFTIVAGLESGITDKEKFFSGPSIVVDGWTINNADDGLYTSGYENLEDILTYSFNVGCVSVFKRIGRKKFIDYLEKFGFYELSGVEHPSDVYPIVGDLQNEPDIRFATISFGQGIAISPLHILKFMTMIANGGYKVNLTFIKGKNKMDNKVLSDYTVNEIRKYLRSVVVRGTGKNAEVNNYYCAGKTGTAQVAEDGVYKEGKYVASFVGFFPYFDPQYVIVVSVKEPVGMYYGGQVAAPIFHDTVLIINSLYGIKPYSSNFDISKNSISQR